jgi:2,3-bisphosphoglycerate-dependent phosphoglycerate mutase
MKTLLLLTLLLTASPVADDQACQGGTVVLVRHAEKVTDDPKDNDPPLRAVGIDRAKELSRLLQDAGIDRIFVSERRRTQETAAPIAERLGLEAERVKRADTATLPARIRSELCGQEVLIVGHSDTVPELIRALGIAAPPEIAEDEYDRLFFLRWSKQERSTLLTLRYGR